VFLTGVGHGKRVILFHPCLETQIRKRRALVCRRRARATPAAGAVLQPLRAAEAGWGIRDLARSAERLDPDSLEVGNGNVLYCRVKDGAERARLLRPAYYPLAYYIEEAASGQFELRCGGATHPIARG